MFLKGQECAFNLQINTDLSTLVRLIGDLGPRPLKAPSAEPQRVSLERGGQERNPRFSGSRFTAPISPSSHQQGPAVLCNSLDPLLCSSGLQVSSVKAVSELEGCKDSCFQENHPLTRRGVAIFNRRGPPDSFLNPHSALLLRASFCRGSLSHRTDMNRAWCEAPGTGGSRSPAHKELSVPWTCDTDTAGSSFMHRDSRSRGPIMWRVTFAPADSAPS